jgi:hypothetical protein
VGTTALGWILCALLLAIGVVWLLYLRPRQLARAADPPVGVGETLENA